MEQKAVGALDYIMYTYIYKHTFIYPSISILNRHRNKGVSKKKKKGFCIPTMVSTKYKLRFIKLFSK